MSLEKGRMHSVNGLRRLMLFIWLSCGDFVSRGGRGQVLMGRYFFLLRRRSSLTDAILVRAAKLHFLCRQQRRSCCDGCCDGRPSVPGQGKLMTLR